MKIIKRDGSIVDYNPEKIRIAIKKANNEVSRKEKATEALQKCSFFTAIMLISKRLLKCHPWGKYGYDPVPVQKYRKEK